MRLLAPPDAVVFDMDGLLFDTEAMYRETAILTARDFGLVLQDEVFLGLVGRPWLDNRARLLEHYGAAFPVDAFEALWMRHFDRRAKDGIPLKPGVPELLALLDQSRLPRAITTSSSHDTVRRNLAAHGLSSRFDAIVARGDTVSGKPAPDPFLRAA